VVTVDDQAPVNVGRSEKMSKSKRNTIDPMDLIARYGADAARFFMISDTPPTRDLDWSEAGIEGCARYINRLYGFYQQMADAATHAETGTIDPALLPTLQTALHQAIKDVTEQLADRQFNRAVASLRTLTNLLDEQRDGLAALVAAGNQTARALLADSLTLMYPLLPHLAEELWAGLGFDGLVAQASWPLLDQRLLVKDHVTVAVQVNGKLRGTVDLPPNSDELAARSAAEALSTAQAAIVASGQIRKVIWVQDKLVNLVCGG
jgi:leucyl-tRNA synthetase